MSFKITITDNKNGEVILNEKNAVAIIGAVTTKEKTSGLGYTKCNAFEIIEAICGAESVISKLKKTKTPKLNFYQILEPFLKQSKTRIIKNESSLFKC